MAHPETPEAVDAPATLSMADAAAVFDDLPEEGEDEVLPQAEDEAEEGEDLELEEDDQEGDEDEPEAPAIDPPASLNAEEKKAFAQLPPEAQQLIADVETRRNQQVQEATTKAANREREAETAQQQAAVTAQRHFAAQLVEFSKAYLPDEPQRAWYADDASYLVDARAYDNAIAQHNAIVQQALGMRDEANEAQAEIDHSQRVADLMTVPKLADPATRADYIKSTLEVIAELGLNPEAFEKTASSADFKATEQVAEWRADSIKYRAALSRQMQRVRAGKSKTLRPSAAQTTSGAERVSTQAMKAFRSNPSDRRAAAAVFEDI